MPRRFVSPCEEAECGAQTKQEARKKGGFDVKALKKFR
jgi:hypothetical protein